MFVFSRHLVAIGEEGVYLLRSGSEPGVEVRVAGILQLACDVFMLSCYVVLCLQYVLAVYAEGASRKYKITKEVRS